MPRAESVSVAVVRAAFEESGLTRRELAERLGWRYRSRDREWWDTVRVARALGLKAQWDCSGVGGRRRYRRRMRAALADEIFLALGRFDLYGDPMLVVHRDCEICGRPYSARGMCSTHYAAWWKRRQRERLEAA